jgi:hypothetical protein
MSDIEQNKQVKQFQPIEYMAYWEGGVNSTTLAKCINISPLTARKHIILYLDNYPQNLIYNANSPDKLYVPNDSFKLHTVSNRWEDYLAFTSSINSLNAIPIYNIFDSSCTATIQNVDNEIFRGIYKAINRKEKITIKYLTDQRPEGIVQIIQPHALASSGLLWYCRAFCNQSNSFKDFFLGRIKTIILTESSTMRPQVDHDWDDYISLKITANKNLPLSIQKLVLFDYGQTKQFEVRVRKSMVAYFVEHQKICVDENGTERKEKPLMLLNANEIQSLIGLNQMNLG